MVVLGTKPEYFNAVWVKNEWSRYLALIKGGKRKALIPAYKDMDPYDLPDEFSHLQAQDMSKLGFMHDLVYGIKKITDSTEPKQMVKETVVMQGNADVAPLLKRVFMFLEDGEWDNANEYCEKVLDINPECAEAYLGKLMAELKVNEQENLADYKEPFVNSNNYKKVLKFADEKLSEKIKNYISNILKRTEQEKLNERYLYAIDLIDSANSEEQFKCLAEIFDELKDYKDSKQLREECFNKFKTLQLKNEQSAKEKHIYLERKKKILTKTIAILVSITAFCVIFVILLNSLIIPNVKYNEAVKLYNNEQYTNAYKIFLKLGGYKDSEEYSDKIISINSKEFFNSINVGDIVNFGVYEDEIIEWRVLEKNNDKILLLTDKLIDCKKYNTEDVSITWETCSLRKWLNNDFLDKSFDEVEKEKILETKVINTNNGEYGTAGGNDTNDKVFLLSYDETERYFTKREERSAIGTKYARKNNIAKYTDGDWWWLRSPGENSKEATVVYGTVYSSFSAEEGKFIGIRPAMWIDISE